MPASIKHLTNTKLVQTALAKWEDGLFYPVSLLKCDEKDRKCLVRFIDDNVECSMDARDLHIQLTDDIGEENIVCCICDNEISKVPNEIIICDLCQQGYHLLCHTPPVDRELVEADEEAEWFCSTCKYLTLSPDEQARRSSNIPSTVTVTKSPNKSTAMKKVPNSAKKAPTSTTKKTRASTTSKSTGTANKKAVATETPTTKKVSTADIATKKVPTIETSTPSANSDTTSASQPKAEVESESNTITKIKSPKKTEVSEQNDNNETCLDYTLSKEKLANGSTVEEMCPELIEAAKVLAEKDTVITTKDFVNLISSFPSDLPPPSKKRKSVKKPLKAQAKTVAPAS